MKVNLSIGLTWIKEMYDEGQISRNDHDELVEFVLTYSIYEAAVNREIVEALFTDCTQSMAQAEKVAHETVLMGLVRDLDKKRKAIL